MSTSLYAITLETQEIDGELSIALAQLSTDDPAAHEEAEAIIGNLLERANTTQAALTSKCNSICHVIEGLRAKAEFLRSSAEDRAAKALAEDKAADRLTDYMTRCLGALHPGQKKFSLAEYTISKGGSEAIEVSDPGDLPDDLVRIKVEVRLSPGERTLEFADQVYSVINETLTDLFELNPSEYDVKIDRQPDKTAIKTAIKGGRAVPGAELVQRTHWKIK